EDRRVDRERPLDANPEAHLPNRERLAGTAPLAPDHDALEHLGALAVPLDHADVDLQGVAGGEIGDVVAQVCAVDEVSAVHEKAPGGGAGEVVSGRGGHPGPRPGAPQRRGAAAPGADRAAGQGSGAGTAPAATGPRGRGRPTAVSRARPSP